MKCYLLDLENIERSLKWCCNREYAEDDRVYVFYSDELCSSYGRYRTALSKKCNFVRGIYIGSKGKNALDFNLAAVLGMVIQEVKGQGKDSLDVIIVSDDMGYRNLQSFATWSKINFSITVNMDFVGSDKVINRGTAKKRGSKKDRYFLKYTDTQNIRDTLG